MGRMDRMETELRQDLKGEMDKHKAELKQDYERLKTSVGIDIEVLSDKVESDLGKMDKRVQGTEGDVKGLQRQVTELNIGFETGVLRYDNMEHHVEVMEKRLIDIKDCSAIEFAHVKAQVKTVESTVHEHASSMEEMKSMVEQNRQDLDKWDKGKHRFKESDCCSKGEGNKGLFGKYSKIEQFVAELDREGIVFNAESEGLHPMEFINNMESRFVKTGFDLTDDVKLRIIKQLFRGSPLEWLRVNNFETYDNLRREFVKKYWNRKDQSRLIGEFYGGMYKGGEMPMSVYLMKLYNQNKYLSSPIPEDILTELLIAQLPQNIRMMLLTGGTDFENIVMWLKRFESDAGPYTAIVPLIQVPVPINDQVNARNRGGGWPNQANETNRKN
jgi:hypothetical protein